MNATIIALAYAVMALGLNIVVGFAGLLDLGYVAFYALGAYSRRLVRLGVLLQGSGPRARPRPVARTLTGIHLNFLLILIAARRHLRRWPASIIGLPTLRLRGDYIAIVTLAFGEIIGMVAVNGAEHPPRRRHDADRRQPRHQRASTRRTSRGSGRSTCSNLQTVVLADLRDLLIVLFVNLRLRDSRLGRAWIALREDEVAAVSMGIPLVKTKLLAYAIGAAFGGMAGAFLGDLLHRGQRRPVRVRVLDLHPRDGDHRRPRIDLGRGRSAGCCSPTSTTT